MHFFTDKRYGQSLWKPVDDRSANHVAHLVEALMVPTAQYDSRLINQAVVFPFLNYPTLSILFSILLSSSLNAMMHMTNCWLKS